MFVSFMNDGNSSASEELLYSLNKNSENTSTFNLSILVGMSESCDAFQSSRLKSSFSAIVIYEIR